MVKVTPRSRYVGVDFSQPPHRLGPIVRPLLLATDRLLSLAQPPFGLPQKLRVVDYRSVREGREHTQPQVDSDYARRLGEAPSVAIRVSLNDETREIAACGVLDHRHSGGLGRQLPRPSDRNLADFR